jgi:hypothetical protein
LFQRERCTDRPKKRLHPPRRSNFQRKTGFTNLFLTLWKWTPRTLLCTDNSIYVHNRTCTDNSLHHMKAARTVYLNQIAAFCNPFFVKKTKKKKELNLTKNDWNLTSSENLTKKDSETSFFVKFSENIFLSGYPLNVHLFSSSLYKCTCCTNVQGLVTLALAMLPRLKLTNCM